MLILIVNTFVYVHITNGSASWSRHILNSQVHGITTLTVCNMEVAHFCALIDTVVDPDGGN